MRTDEQYGQQLGVELRHETADLHAAPDLVRKLRGRQARRSWTIRTAIATPVAAAAAAAILVTMPGQGAPDPTQQPNGAQAQLQNGAQVQLESVAYVQEQTVKALGRASQYVIHAESTYRGGHYDRWIDRATQRYRHDAYTSEVPACPWPDGKPRAAEAEPSGKQTAGPVHLSQSHSVSGPKGNQTLITVNYDRKCWSKVRAPYEGDVPLDITDADSVRKAIGDGTVELLGNEKVDGVDTLHLRLTGPHSMYRIDMWVDSTAYLPVRETAARGDGEKEPFLDSTTNTTTYTWLPRTGENLARLVLTPPPGFRQVK